MVNCHMCNISIKNGDEYKIAYDDIWCISCADELELYDGEYGISYTFFSISSRQDE